MENNLKNFVTLKLPVDLMLQAIKVAAQAKKDHAKIEAEKKEEYPTQNREKILRQSGEDGARRYDEYCADCAARKATITQKAQKEINALWEKAVVFIDNEVTPKGEQVINEPDFALLDHDIVDEEQLARLIEKHADNTAFRLAAARYARRHFDNWEEFAAFDKEKSVREYTDQVFRNIGVAASHPSGPVAIQYVETPSEYARIAIAHGLKEEFAASGGNRLYDLVTAL